MKIKHLWSGWLIAALWCIMAVTTVYGAFDQGSVGDDARVYDGAGLLTDSQKEQFEQQIAEYQEEYNLDIVVVTTKDTRGKTSTQYADDFYDEGGFGQGKDRDGILFLIDMDNRELTFSTSGKAIRIFTDERIDQMLDGVYEGASLEDYQSSVDSFLADVRYYCRKGIPGGQYNYDTETGKISVYKSIRWYEILLAVGVAGFVAGSACLWIKRSYGMEESQTQIRNLNMAYRADAAFIYDQKHDKMINSFVTTRIIPRDTGSTGRGGGSSSGRSSTHRSSSGRSHGGGSRKF